MSLKPIAVLSVLLLLHIDIIEISAQTESAVAEKSEKAESGEWVVLIDSEGPIGITKVGEKVTVCADVTLDEAPKKLKAVPGKGVVAALSRGNNLLSKQEFGDCEVQLEFLIAKSSNSGVKLQQRYEIQLYDSHGKENLSAKECGGIYPHWKFQGKGKGLKYIDKGVPPNANAAKPAGEWQTLSIIFKAPRFNNDGKKTENAKFVSVELNGQTIHENVEVDSPTGNASTPMPEVAEAPLFLQLDHGAVAFRNVRVKPLQ